MAVGTSARTRAVAGLVALAATAAACGSGYHYAKSVHPTVLYRTGDANGYTGLAQVKAASTYFKLPPNWTILDEEAYRKARPIEADTPEQAFIARNKSRIQPFDAAPKPHPDHVLSTSAFPSGFSQVFAMDDIERDNVSLNGLRNLLLQSDPDQVGGEAGAEVLFRDDAVVKSGGFHGNRVIANVVVGPGIVVTFDKTTLVDANTRIVYMFLVSCEAKCFRERQGEIADVVKSWTIRER